MKKRIALLVLASVLAGLMLSFDHYWVFSYTTAIVIYLCVSLARFQVKQEKRWILSINGTASAITWAKKKPSVKDFGYTTEDAENLAAFNRIEITPLNED